MDHRIKTEIAYFVIPFFTSCYRAFVHVRLKTKAIFKIG